MFINYHGLNGRHNIINEMFKNITVTKVAYYFNK